jgi:pimeloyl-ACP methyl ester carboxylesterase
VLPLLTLLLVLIAAAVATFLWLRAADLEARFATPADHTLDHGDGLRLHYRDEGRPDAPVLLLLHGEIDPILPLEHSRRFAAAIPGAELIVCPGVGHLPQREIPQRSAADVAAFVACLPAGT